MKSDIHLIEKKAQILNLFKCLKSGNCCKCPGFVYVSPQNLEGMSKIKKLTQKEFSSKYVTQSNGWDAVATPSFRGNCFLNEDNTCSVYSARPSLCRTYPDWEDIWKDDEALLKETELCPGLKKAVSEFSGA